MQEVVLSRYQLSPLARGLAMRIPLLKWKERRQLGGVEYQSSQLTLALDSQTLRRQRLEP